jgi:chromosome segregation ATPase
MTTSQRIAFGWFVLVVAVNAVGTMTEEFSQAGANPIRKVVTLLQNMAKETEAEGDRAQDLFDKFNCYCTSTEASLKKSIEEAKAHVSELSSGIEEISGSNAQLEQELKDIAKDISAATKSINEASAQRKTEGNEYAAESAEMSNTIGALDSAIPALKEGLETPSAVFAQLNSRLGAIAPRSSKVQSLLALKAQSQLEGTGSDAILGVLEQMRDDFKQNLIEATQQEEEALKTFKQLTGAKKKEIAAGTEETNEKAGRLAGQKQQGADYKADLEDTSVSLAADEKTIIAVMENCKLKTDEHEAAKKARNEELAGISAAVKILNSDEALELMKKTLPGEGASFLQTSSTRKWRRHRIRAMMSYSTSPLTFAQVNMHVNGPEIDLAPLKQKAAEMISSMQEEQKDEDTRMALCKKELDTTADEKKALSTALLQAESRMGVITNEIEDIEASIKEVQTEIAEVDMSVQEATLQRKKEKAEFTSVMSELTMTADLLLKAKQVLEKMYAPPAMQEKEAFIQQRSSSTIDDALDDFLSKAPETAGPAKGQGAAGMGAVGLLSTLIADVKNQQKVEEKEEADSQSEYDKYMEDTSSAKASKKNDITNMETSVSRLEETLNDQKTVHGETQDEMDSVVAKEHALHSECDFLLENYDEIKKARTDEVESINNAIAILSGADFGKEEGFLQHRQY